MNAPTREQVVEAAGWIILLAVVTVGMHAVRDRLNDAHIALTYLLIVLGASARGGRVLGLTLAGVAFVLFDVLFLPPYGTLVINNPLDWLVLFAFLVTSVVATQLLYRARDEADRAERRAVEIDRLASLGAESLNAGRPEDALVAVADVLRTTLGVDQCLIFTPDQPTPVAQSPADATPSDAVAQGLVSWVLTHATEAVVSTDGTTRLAWDGPIRLDASGPAARALLLPLRVRERTVGALSVVRTDGLILDQEQRRVLDALSYYAALGVERGRLVAEAQYSDALRQADRLKDALIAAVSHDLRTPLTTIKALAHDIATGGDERAIVIEHESDRLNQFVGDLLDLSRIQAGGLRPSPEPNEAEDLVGAALQRVSGAAAGRQITVTLDGEFPVLIGRFDFSDTLRALVNLLDNAIKYAPPDMPVELDVRRDGDWIAFAVSDRGPGVAEAEAERVFEPFYRPSSVSPDVGGAGLGLTIARRLMAAQGGSVTYTPRPGGGAVFTLRVPLIEASGE